MKIAPVEKIETLKYSNIINILNKSAMLLLCATLFMFSGCLNQRGREINIIDAIGEETSELLKTQIPFDNGKFFLSLSYYDKPRETTLRFNEEGVRHGWSGKDSISANFQENAADFIDMMNSLSPKLIDAAICDRSTLFPFKRFSGENSLYDIHDSGSFFWIFIYKTEDFGYMTFYIQDKENSNIQGLHTLYRITKKELEKIIEFAEKLDRTERHYDLKQDESPVFF
ncbi:MAG: hypothetical protein FWD44_05960 [Oscillospiraceae bacterium]|nr:hypothetical protein [Oscillospiraceae bacterium]